MVMTSYGKSGAALLFCGSANVPRYMAIGSGSGAAVATLGSLIAECLGSRVTFTSRDISTNQQVVFTHDFTSTQMSGILLTEFGIGGSIAKGTNDLWLREAFPSITFDGTNELEIICTFQTF